jgi:uncharacterized membrane protein YebE (DUF533 family)
MFTNPAWKLRVPSPVRRILQRRVEAAGAVVPSKPVALGGELAAGEPAPLAPIDESMHEPAHGMMTENSPLADTTLAGLTALRSADAEVAGPALLAGAKAHGPIDQAHLKIILQHLDEVGATDADHRYVLAHLTGPPDMQEMFSRVHDLTTAQETYALAATMIDQDKPAERDWLAELRRRLGEIVARLR